jgi:hypothetical protein
MLFKEFRFVSRELKEFRDGREDKIKCLGSLDQFLAKYNLPEKFHILITYSIASQNFGKFAGFPAGKRAGRNHFFELIGKGVAFV